jgi:hypothetical protein
MAAPAFGQQQQPDTLPLPLASPVAIQPGTIQPLSVRGKAWNAVTSTFSVQDIVNRVAIAGLDQWTDDPDEWPQGMKGYGWRLASRFGRSGVRHALMLGTDIVLKTDYRYERCECLGFGSRTKHALRRVLVIRKDNGGETINMTRLVGAYVTPVITDQWLPDRLNTVSRKLTGGTTYLGWNFANNMLKEFWPDIKTRIFRKK